jgi:1,4-alpha-glucan branching enzyme
MSTLGTFSLNAPPPEAGAEQIRDDPYLEPFKHDLRNRFEHYAMVKAKILKAEGSLESFSQGYTRLGFRRLPHSIAYSEWAPGARRAWLVGDFSMPLL